MKSAEELVNGGSPMDKCSRECEASCKYWKEYIKQIQLESMKEEMRKAAEMVRTTPCWSDDLPTAAEQLTEKDL